jgi:hypothetical protein
MGSIFSHVILNDWYNEFNENNPQCRCDEIISKALSEKDWTALTINPGTYYFDIDMRWHVISSHRERYRKKKKFVAGKISLSLCIDCNIAHAIVELLDENEMGYEHLTIN